MILRCAIFGMIVLAAVCAEDAFAADAVISVSGFEFVPADVTIDAGDMVTWTGLGSSHNVEESDSALSNDYNGTGFRSGNAGAVPTFQQTFNSPGTFFYICEPHASLGMKGSVTVNAAAAMPTTTYTGYVFLVAALLAASSFVLVRSSRR